MKAAFPFGFLLLIVCSRIAYSMQQWSLQSTPNSLSLGVEYLALVLLYLLVLRNFRNSRDPIVVVSLVFFAILARLTLLGAPVLLTGDLPRYLAEGFMVRHGYNPYLISPEAFLKGYQGKALLAPWWQQIEYANLTAIYPPAAQFALAYFAKTITSWRFFLIAADALTCFFLLRMTVILGFPIGRTLIYAYLPLPFIEIAISGHLDGLMNTFLFAFLYFTLADRLEGMQRPFNWVRALKLGIPAALSVLTKYVAALPILAYLYQWKGGGEQGALLRFVGGFLLSCLLIAAIFLTAPLAIFTSLTHYLSHWRFNDSLLHLLGWLAGADWNDLGSFVYIKYALLILWATVLAFLIRSKVNFLQLTAYGFATYLLLSSTFHPWYALWYAPFLCFIRSRALIYLALILPLSYLTKFTGSAELPVWVKLVEFIPVYVLLVLELREIILKRE